MAATSPIAARVSAAHRGFTLLELMIVIVIVVILARIAISAYTEQVHKSRRAEAVSILGQLQTSLETYRAENPCYAASGDASCSDTYNATGNYPDYTIYNTSSNASYNQYYAISLTYPASVPIGTGAVYYTLTATARSGSAQSGDRCGTLCAYNSGATPTTSCGNTKPKWSNSDCN
jgi:prepilin-type N-terminal cleavage/methylation domain-containing protein